MRFFCCATRGTAQVVDDVNVPLEARSSPITILALPIRPRKFTELVERIELVCAVSRHSERRRDAARFPYRVEDRGYASHVRVWLALNRPMICGHGSVDAAACDIARHGKRGNGFWRRRLPHDRKLASESENCRRWPGAMMCCR